MAIAADNKDDPEVRELDVLHSAVGSMLLQCEAKDNMAASRSLANKVEPLLPHLQAFRRDLINIAKTDLSAAHVQTNCWLINPTTLQAFRRDLINIAKTTLSSKILTQGALCLLLSYLPVVIAQRHLSKILTQGAHLPGAALLLGAVFSCHSAVAGGTLLTWGLCMRSALPLMQSAEAEHLLSLLAQLITHAIPFRYCCCREGALC